MSVVFESPCCVNFWQSPLIKDFVSFLVAISNRLLNNKTLLNKTAPLSKFGDLKNGYAFKSSAYVPNGNYNIVTIANVNGDREIVTDNCNTISSVPTDVVILSAAETGNPTSNITLKIKEDTVINIFL